jgi:hypothetical protein
MTSRRSTATRWPLERALFALAGTVTLVSAVGVAFVSPWFALLTAFVAISQLLFVAVGDCPASLVLRHGLGLRPAAGFPSCSAASSSARS